jgi:Zn-dependent protease with chaperone function/competence protein ComGC
MTSSTASTPPVLDVRALSVAKEKTYFGWVLIISIIVWLLLTISMVGLFYAAFFAVFLWFGNGLLIAYLRSEAVQVGPDQLPELHAAFKTVCDELGLKETPGLYVLQSGGLLNAFATRFSGRDFVVVYSDFLDALGADSAEMKFILGHEVGHIKSRHILKQILLAPGLFAPLVGPAYRRAWESSCDRHGAYASQDIDGSIRAMMVLSGGPGHANRLSSTAFARQHHQERGFFISLHELTSTYPTLSRRVSDLEALRSGETAPAPKRHPFAYFIALGMPGGNLSGGGPAAGMLMVIVVIGLLAAMAIPAFAKVRETSQAKMCENNCGMLSSALDQYRLEKGQGATNWDEVIGSDKIIPSMPVCPKTGTYEATFDENASYVVTCDADHTAGQRPAR